ncbi:MAG: LysM peptidoglycan-binding domain-containing protein [Flavobacterium sp.]
MKYIILIALSFFSNSFYSQNYKTNFSNHEVKSKETIYSVSNMYNLSAEELIEFNPVLKEKGIQLGMILKVPTIKIEDGNQDKKETPNNEIQTAFKSDNLYETKSYYKDGQIQCKGKYLNGIRISEWILYYHNGQINIKVNYGDNEKVNEYIKYYENGKIVDKRSFLTGEWILYYENNQLKYKGNYKDGKPVGIWITYYENGQIKEKRDYLTEEWNSYYESGQIHESGKYLNNNSDIFYDNGRSNDIDKYIKYSKGTNDKGWFSINRLKSDTENYKIQESQLSKNYSVNKDADFSRAIKEHYVNDDNFIVEGINYIESDINISNGRRDGSWISYYEKGQIKEKGKYVNGELIDDWISYYENGKIRSKGNCSNGEWFSYSDEGKIWEKGKFEDGKPAGEWIWYFDSKLISSERNFSSGELISYYDNGQIEEKINYSNGEWFFYDKKGKVLGKGKYEGEKPVGEWIFNHENGKIKTKINYETSEYVGYYENGDIKVKINLSTGKIIYYYAISGKIKGEENCKTGESISYFGNGQIYEKGFYKNGNKEGIWTQYEENGSVKVIENYKVGELISDDYDIDRLSNTYDKNGELIENHNENQLDGEWIKYYANGQIEIKGFYKNRKREGEWLFYDMNYERIENVNKAVNGNLKMSNNRLSAKHNYRNGMLDGECIWYYDNGQIREKEYYLNGKLDCRVE